MNELTEPKIHSHITVMLPDDHPLAYMHTHCAKCGDLVHAGNNMVMQTWIETGKGCFCVACFNFLHIHEAMHLREDWGLPESGQVNVVAECEHVWIDATNQVITGTAFCVRCGGLEILGNVELCEDTELIKDLIKTRNMAPIATDSLVVQP